MRGRKPKPSNLKVFRGNPGKRGISKEEPRPAVGVPAAPPHLEGAVRAAWDQIGATVARLGVVTIADGIALEALVRAYVYWRECVEKLAVTGAVMVAKGKGKDGLPIMKRSPYAIASENAQHWLHRWLCEFGLTPAARARVAVAPTVESEAERKMFGG